MSFMDDVEEAEKGQLKTGDELAKSKLNDGLWRTLDTAPRDGTPVDLWHKNGFRLTEVWWADDCWSCVMDDSSFTHWMPIPPAP